MDQSITLATPDMHRKRGADAFDRGASFDEHNMNPGSPAIADWQFGWKRRQSECMRPPAQNTQSARRSFDAAHAGQP